MPEKTYSFKEIGDQIYAKLNEIVNTRLWAVYNRDVKIEDWISLPAITITPNNWTVELLDSCSYQSKYEFNIRLFDRIQDDIAGVEDNMRILADEIMSKLKEVGTITWTNSNWMSVKVEYEWNWRYSNTQEPLRVFEVKMVFTAIER